MNANALSPGNMPPSRRPAPGVRRSRSRRLATAAVWAILTAALALPAHALVVRPSEAIGDFHAHMDIQEILKTSGGRDLVLLFSIANSELTFEEEWGGAFKGGVRVRARLEVDGAPDIERVVDVPLETHSRRQAASGTMYQVFVVTLEDVPGAGYLDCRLEDTGKPSPREVRHRDGSPTAEIQIDWQSMTLDLRDNSLYITPPVFLAGAPAIKGRETYDSGMSGLMRDISGYLHPNRRYGLEAEKLQVRFDAVAWRLDPMKRDRLPKKLLIQVLAKDLDYVLRDTLTLYDDPLSLLNGGGHARIGWELDVNKLPTGVYQLSCAPLDGFGNAWLAEFDVHWTLSAYNRSDAELDLTGKLVLTGERLERFKESGRDERAIILSEFWEGIDPDPETRVNEALIEYKRRIRYVDKHLGGFGRGGPVDDRGLVYLYLGPPDEIEKRDMPSSGEEFEDALDAVYDAYAPIRGSLFQKDNHDKDRSIYETVQSRREKRSRLTRTDRYKGFQIWYYDREGDQLFPNVYSGMTPGSRFLFLLRLGGSVYHLESTNVFDVGAIGN